MNFLLKTSVVLNAKLPRSRGGTNRLMEKTLRIKAAIILVLNFLFIPGLLRGQVKPDYFPEDVDSNAGNAEIRCFCKPGVRDKSRSKGLEISYGLIGKGHYMPEQDNFPPPFSAYTRWQNLEVDLKVPLVNLPGWKFLLGYRYIAESARFRVFGSDYRETFETLDQKHLKSNTVSLLLSKIIDEKRYLILRLRNSANGNYSGLQFFNPRYNILKAAAMFGVKRNEDFEWGVGLNFSSGFRNRFTLLPFILYNRNFNRKWGIESAFPAFVFIRYNVTPRAIALAGIEYSSHSYRLEVDAGQHTPYDYAYNHSEILASVRMERQIVPWVWAQVKVGYQYNLSSDFDAKNGISPAFQVEPTNAPFLNISLFLSPPEKMIK